MDVLKSFAEDIKQVEENIDDSKAIYQSVLLSRELDAFQNRVVFPPVSLTRFVRSSRFWTS